MQRVMQRYVIALGESIMVKVKAAAFLVLTGIMALFFAVSVAMLYKNGINGTVALLASCGIAVVCVFLQYLLGPILLDWILKIQWTSPIALGTDFADWHRKTCASINIPEPRVGIIEDGMPNAFTYGHGPWNARVVVTRGLVDALTPEELRAVYAHELGHIRNRDFILMTIVQGLVLVLYCLARTNRGRDSLATAAAAYVVYWVSYYASLLFSRLREYLADYTSAQITQDPNALARALVKIAYGLATTTPTASPVRQPSRPRPTTPSYGQSMATAVPPAKHGKPGQIILPGNDHLGQQQPQASQNYNPYPDAGATAYNPYSANVADPTFQMNLNTKNDQRVNLRGLGAFGICGAASMRAAVSWFSPTGGATPDNFAKVARWDLYNPWARIAELISTHPLTAYRIKALQKLCDAFRIVPEFDFRKVQPAKYNRFFVDLLLVALPLLMLGIGIGASYLLREQLNPVRLVLLPVLLMLVGSLVTLFARYPGGQASRSKVLTLLSEVDVSHVNAKYVVLEGTFTGKLESGLPWANDFILQDETGFVACIYRQPFGFLEMLWGYFSADGYIGRPVRVKGWFRRFNAPYLEIDSFETLDAPQHNKCYHYVWSAIILIIGLAAAGAAFALVK